MPLKDPVRNREYCRAYYSLHRIQITAHKRAMYAMNREYGAKRSAEYVITHPGRRALTYARQAVKAARRRLEEVSR